MINDIVSFNILDVSLIRILGVITYISFVVTALISIMNARGIKLLKFKWHPRIAITSLILATIHAVFVVLLYL